MHRSPRLPDLQAIIDSLSERRFSSIEDANRYLAKRMREYNSRAQPELGGLSPEQMQSLLSGDWLTSGGMRIDSALSFADVSKSPLLNDARTLLAYARDHGPVKATQAGNLSRAAVAELLPRLQLPVEYPLTSGADWPLPKNEQDVLWLPDVRFALEIAGMLTRRKGFRISRPGRELLDEARAGDLFALLFHTYFRRIDLESLDRFGGHAGLQPTLAFSFYVLHSAGVEWSSPAALAEAAWLPSARDEPAPFELADPTLRHWPFTRRVLRPLVAFALLEEREIPAIPPAWRPVEMRKTPLYDRFIRFAFGPSAI